MPLNLHTRRNAKPKRLKTVRLEAFEIRNESTGLYHTVKCKNVNGVAVLYLSDTGHS